MGGAQLNTSITLVDVARLTRYFREVNATINRGLRVEAVQHWAGGSFGDSWCVEMLWVWFDVFTQGNPPFPRGLTADKLRQLAVYSGWIVKGLPLPGDVCLSVNPATGEAHHAALVTQTLPLWTIAGNTSEDGLSSNGDRVAEHRVSPSGKVFFRVPNLSPFITYNAE